MRATAGRETPLGAVPGLRDVRDRVAVPSPLLLCRPAPIWCATPSREGRGDRDPVEPHGRGRDLRVVRPSRASGPRGVTGRRQPSADAERKSNVLGVLRREGVPPASPELAGFLSGFSVSNPSIESPSWSLTTKSTTLDGGSLGSWVDEDRSKMRVVV